MTQLDLFNHAPRARATNPRTSHEAAARVAPMRESLSKRILRALQDRDLTDDQICEVLAEPVRRWPSIKTARSALSVRTDDARTWKNPIHSTGREIDGQTVWTTAFQVRSGVL